MEVSLVLENNSSVIERGILDTPCENRSRECLFEMEIFKNCYTVSKLKFARVLLSLLSRKKREGFTRIPEN